MSGTEPVPEGLSLVHEHGRAVCVLHRGRLLLRYVYRPWDAQVESPRPYFHPVHTSAGDEVTLYRPHDHVWHKGIAWSLPNVGPANFWGGTTYRRGRGYVQLDNDGAMSEKAVSSGKVTAAEVAGNVFRAIETDQFYVYSHPKALGNVKSRMEGIVAGINPADPFLERPEIGEQLRAALRSA